MHLIQILLPLYDNDAQLLAPALFTEVKAELTEMFGGLTAYMRSPAEGLSKDAGNEVKDEIIIFEVMIPSLDTTWWQDYRRRLEKKFGQQELVIRALPMQSL